MKAVFTERAENGITISVFIPFGRSMLESETFISTSVNSDGQVSTSEALSIFGTDGRSHFGLRHENDLKRCFAKGISDTFWRS